MGGLDLAPWEDGYAVAASIGMTASTIKTWSTHSARRARNKQQLSAALARSKALSYALLALEQPNDACEIGQRLATIAPALKAQLCAAAAGIEMHSSRNLLDADAHVLSGAAKHNFKHPRRQITPAIARREQRSSRQKKVQPEQVPAPPPLHSLQFLDPAIIAVGPNKPKVCVQYIVVEVNSICSVPGEAALQTNSCIGSNN